MQTLPGRHAEAATHTAARLRRKRITHCGMAPVADYHLAAVIVLWRRIKQIEQRNAPAEWLQQIQERSENGLTTLWCQYRADEPLTQMVQADSGAGT